MLPLLRKAIAAESDPVIKPVLEMAAAGLEIRSPDKAVRIAAIRTLGSSGDPSARTLLAPVVERSGDGSFVEKDDDVYRAARASLSAVEERLAWGQRAGLLFSGASLGSILLLAALGLAITYGLMGVINMAHGELIMIGAYTTYVVQGLFRAHVPAAFDWYLAAALPAAFAASALVGMA